jgi:hypothetical protein
MSRILEALFLSVTFLGVNHAVFPNGVGVVGAG